MNYTASGISQIVKGILLQENERSSVQYLVTDSRSIIFPETSMFIAIKGERHDGHEFVEELYNAGVRNFMLETSNRLLEGANIIQVQNSLNALQDLAAWHRRQFNIPVLGITGSNGKTIVKEWLYQLLKDDYNVIRSPKSYNSQVGVPLSVWQMEKEHTLAVFEAGISQAGEMEKLEKIISPTLGIFTNIGDAHSQGFTGITQKIDEKLQLFKNCGLLIYCCDHEDIHLAFRDFQRSYPGLNAFTWSQKGAAGLEVKEVTREHHYTIIRAVYKGRETEIKIPFEDPASVQNAIHCWCFMLAMDLDDEHIRERFQLLSPIEMRLQLKEGINNCTLINDSYNSDLNSLRIALEFLNMQDQHEKKTVILSDILQSGQGKEELYRQVARLLEQNKIDRLIGIGPQISTQFQQFSMNRKFYFNTQDFLLRYQADDFRNETILLKGARTFEFEKISRRLERKAHETVLEINLNALVHNLNFFRSMLKPETRIMAMVKAFSYGSGSYEIARTLQYHHVDYLAVAYADEGVELRKAGIILPIMVMNPDENSFASILQHKLEPEIYNLELLKQYSEEVTFVLNKKQGDITPGIHIEFDTGMNRLGFGEEETGALINFLKQHTEIKVQSVFTHLAGSDESVHDDFTFEQLEKFREISDNFCREFDYPIIRHALNSSGISRFPQHQMDMVRLGIGLYGIDPSGSRQSSLRDVETLRTIISQVRKLPAGETVGYGRKGKTGRDTTIAIVALGYADGLDRRLSNGKGSMLINGKKAPIIGNVCMDMTMLDITDIDANVGDEVIVFGPELPVRDMAVALDTIPYEILTGISQRVKRVYFQE
jgi:alanine racemase